MTDKTAPKTRLKLEWVYGYKGYQCRNNLFYTKNDEVVYFVAGVGIVYVPKTQTQKFFLGHNDDIMSLALHPSRTLVATGQIGKAPFICVWSTDSMQTLSLLKDVHTDGISCLAFSKTGEKLASVGLDTHHLVAVWEWKKGNLLAKIRGHTERIFDVAWAESDDRLVTCGVKHIKFWTQYGNSLASKNGLFGKVGSIQTILSIAFGDDGTVYSGTMSGEIYVWKDVNLERTIPNVHKGAVHTIYKTEEGFVTGGRDGVVVLWDLLFNYKNSIPLSVGPRGSQGICIRSVCKSNGKLLVGTQDGEIFEINQQKAQKLIPLILGHSEGELWGLAVHPTKPMAATASDDCTVRIWRLATHELEALCNVDHPARSCAFGYEGEFLAVGCKNGSFYVFKTADVSQLVHIHDRKEVLHEMKYSPDGSYLAVASNDNYVDIYSTKQDYRRVGTCSKSSSFITHIDWSKDGDFLQTNDGAGERLVYSMPSGRHVTNGDQIRAIVWMTWTCVLGSEVFGMWPKYSQINDVNAVDASIVYNTMATGDDFGLVKLFRFPSMRKDAQFRKYVGHSAHVTNVRFSCDNHWLLSTGGADHALFQWTFITDEKGGSQLSRLTGMEPDTGGESLSERSDSDLSDVSEVDSELEQEIQVSHNREMYKEDLARVKENNKENDSLRSRTKKARPGNTGNASLQLSYVFGYRGYDCRDNIFYTKSQEIVYHVAAVAVVYSSLIKTQRFYDKHDDDILCLTAHPHKDIIATGQVGRTPAIHVWDVANLTTISVLKGFHERGVTSLAFSADGKKLASIGLDNDHSMAIWDWKRGQKLATTRTHQDKVFGVCFQSDSSEKLATVGVKHIKFWNHVGGGFTSHRGVFGGVAKMDTMLCVVGGRNGLSYSGGAGGLIFVWKENKLTRTVKAHDGPCYVICSLDKGFVTGGKDGTVCIWDENFNRVKSYPVSNRDLSKDVPGSFLEDHPSIRALCLGSSKVVIGTKNGEIAEVHKSGLITLLMQGHCEGELWGLAPHPTKDQWATASKDRTVRIWSSVNKEERLLGFRKMKVGMSCCGFSPDGNALAVGCVDGSFEVLNVPNLTSLVSYHHRKEEISDIKFSPQTGKYLAVGSHDNFVDIYDVVNSRRVGVCKGASSYITHLDWDARGKLLSVNTGAGELLYFEAPRGKRQTIDSDELIEWHSWTGVLGKICEGIWPSYSDLTDVNAASRSNDGELLITGDDLGLVKLFNYPVYGKHAPFKKYVGHSAHVTNVRWSHDSFKAASTGGADTALFIWKKLKKGVDSALEGGTGSSSTQQGESDDSDTDSEEEGYDSDVNREINMDYSTKIYTTNIRKMKDAPKPSQKEVVKADKPSASREIPKSDKVKKHRKTLSKVNELQLLHIFGYRGFDCRDNVQYIDGGKNIVYHAAGVGIVQNSASKKQSFYFGHSDDIICLATNQNPKFCDVIATGQIGEDGLIHVWGAHSLKCISVLSGFHVGGVCSVAFSGGGRLLVSVGLDEHHTVAVWRWQEGSKMASHPCCRRRIFNAKFRPDSDQSFVTVGVKHVMFWKICGTELLGKRGVLGTAKDVQNQTMLSIAFSANDVTLTGALNGDVYMWKKNALLKVVTKVHLGPVFTMYTTLGDGLIVTGGRNVAGSEQGGAVKLWDQHLTRCRIFEFPGSTVKSVFRNPGKIVVGTQESKIFEAGESNAGAITLVMQGHTEGELWGLSCHPLSHICCTVSLDKTCRVWDLKEREMLRSLKLKAGGQTCSFNNKGNLLAIGHDNGEILILDATTLNLLVEKRDRSAKIYDVKFSPNDKVLAVASENSLDFYEISGEETERSRPELIRSGFCKQIPNYVFQLDFSEDGKFVQAGTGAYEQLVFQVPSGKRITDPKLIGSITWNTWTSVVGDEVVGVWPLKSAKSEVNCSMVSHAGNSIVTGDDFGSVALFDFPCPKKGAAHQEFFGHSAHVTNTRFTRDDSMLVTTGGEDCCVFVWSCS